MDIETVGVVGGGVMGAGIIQTLSSFGYPVRFKDINQEIVGKCLAQVERIYTSALKKGKMTGDQAERGMSLIHGGTGDEGFDTVDLVIEVVPEEVGTKKAVFEHFDRICRPSTILATNTSSFSVTEIASFTSRKPKVIGMHWFNPPHVMKLIEIVPGFETSPETVEVIMQFCGKLGKLPIHVKECAGFVVNRILGIYMNEALFLLEGGGRPAEIDYAALQIGMPMGPLQLGDMAGWDIIYRANQTLYEEYGARFILPKLFSRLIEEGRLGQKVGKGFYCDGPDKPGVPQEQFDHDKLRLLSNRLLFCAINEGIRCFEEGIASAADIDFALQNGAGMPRGPLAWADEIGLDHVLSELGQLTSRYGERFRPSPFLKRKVYTGQTGKRVGKGFFSYSI
jgi:3-hydroxyacyl-CoA dehydrogenase